ncbi:MAG: hypothetical protein NTY15_15725 [Planctomycetota bacterium]|nr:hypothetical protein [Planctomycetota bacterium]
MFRLLPTKLLDCQFHSSEHETELFIVEGDSASNAVGAVRDSAFQAVMPMQGKPLNAWKATRDKVARNEFFHALNQAMGAGWGDSFLLGADVLLPLDASSTGVRANSYGPSATL